MKLIISFILFLTMSMNSQIYAHAGGHGHDNHSSVKEWTFVNQDKKLTASFLNFKNGMATLEDKEGNISQWKLTDFTVNDQQFILRKYENIKLLNQSLGQVTGLSPNNNSVYWQLVFILCLFLSISYLIYKKPKYSIAIPFFLIPLSVTLFSFKSTILSLVTTDPAFIDSAFSPFKPNVATSWDDTYFYVESLGIPEHEMMVGITNWQQQVPIPQCYTGNNPWSIPLDPVIAAIPLSTQDHFKKGAIAIAANGVPIFNAQNNQGIDSYLTGELDGFGGHCGRADDYHYHIAPLHLEDENNILPIAFALDGFAVYGSLEPDGSTMAALDSNNGHYGTDGVYHYHGTDVYPYMIGNMVGEVALDPNTSAPEDQIIPQAMSTPIRPAATPLNGAVITGHEPNGNMGYSLTYTLNNESHTINYDWTVNGQYNFEFVDPNGNPTSESYNSFPTCEIACSNNTYTGTASVTQGLASTTTENIYNCSNGREAGIGTITATDNTIWTVPAENNFQNNSFPLASDLHNPCNGATYTSATQALSALDDSDIVEIDDDGEVITGYIFADNYFELYINGVAVGKDNVPFTQFNSDIVRFKINRPFTIAMKLIDWEENLGVGTESNGGFSHHAGDGGMVAVFKDASDNIIATTGSEWKAQTFYTAPVKDLCCVSENGTARLSGDCNTDGSNDGSDYYGLHWEIPTDWTTESFDDDAWPAATTYTNKTIGVDNKSAYTNFTDIFDDASNNAEFIWSTNVILDNEVIVRYTVEGTTSISNIDDRVEIDVFPNPTSKFIKIQINKEFDYEVKIYDLGGKLILSKQNETDLDLSRLQNGTYILEIHNLDSREKIVQKIIVAK